MHIPLSTIALLKSLVMSHTLLLTVNVHSVSPESVGSWKSVQVTVELLIETGQTPQSESMMYSIEEHREDVQLNETRLPVILVRLTTFGGG